MNNVVLMSTHYLCIEQKLRIFFQLKIFVLFTVIKSQSILLVSVIDKMTRRYPLTLNYGLHTSGISEDLIGRESTWNLKHLLPNIERSCTCHSINILISCCMANNECPHYACSMLMLLNYFRQMRLLEG